MESMRGSIRSRSMGRGGISGGMGVRIKENGLKMMFMGWAVMGGQMGGSIEGNGRRI